MPTGPPMKSTSSGLQKQIISLHNKLETHDYSPFREGSAGTQEQADFSAPLAVVASVNHPLETQNIAVPDTTSRLVSWSCRLESLPIVPQKISLNHVEEELAGAWLPGEAYSVSNSYMQSELCQDESPFLQKLSSTWHNSCCMGFHNKYL